MSRKKNIVLQNHEYKELLEKGSVEVYRELGVSIYNRKPLKDSEYDYEMYIMRAEEKEDKNSMYPTLCKLLINYDSPLNKITYIENPHGKVGDILKAVNNKTNYVVVNCEESRVTSIMKNCLNAHGFGNDMDIIGKFIKSKSHVTSEKFRFVIYSWYNKYTILYN